MKKMNVIKHNIIFCIMIFTVLILKVVTTLASQSSTVTDVVYFDTNKQNNENLIPIFNISKGDIKVESNSKGNIVVTCGNEEPKEFEASQKIIITGTTKTNSVTIVHKTQVNLIIKNLDIDISNESSKKNESAFDLSGDSFANITIIGKNILKSSKFNPGLKIQSNTTYKATAIIDGDGYLEAIGGENASGIGGGPAPNSIGNITINSGKIKAIGGKNASGIGSSRVYSSGNITITGGRVEAIGGEGALEDIGGSEGLGVNNYFKGGSIKALRIGNTPVLSDLDNTPIYLNVIDLESELKDYDITYSINKSSEINAVTDDYGRLYIYLPKKPKHILNLKVEKAKKKYEVTITGNNINIVEIPWGKNVTVNLTFSKTNDIVYNDTVELIAEIQNTDVGKIPTGKITFKNGETILETVNIKQGRAVYNWKNKSASLHNITAYYSGDDNYNNSESLILNINVSKKELTVIAQNEVRKYGKENPIFLIEVKGFIEGENSDNALEYEKPNISCIANLASKIGSYEIKLSEGKAKNYSFKYVYGILNIEKGDIENILFESRTVNYNGMAQNIDIMESLPIGLENIKYSYQKNNEIPTDKIPKDSGKYKVIAKFDVNENCNSIEDKTVDLIINKAPLIIKVNDNIITYGEEPDNCGINYNGFVNGENIDVLIGAIEYSYNYNKNQNVEDGIFTINAKGLTSDNYDISYISGILTVNKSIPYIEIYDTIITYNGKEQKIIPKIIGAKTYKVEYSTYGTDIFTTSIPVDVGIYNVKATTTDDNYIEKTSKAILNIKYIQSQSENNNISKENSSASDYTNNEYEEDSISDYEGKNVNNIKKNEILKQEDIVIFKDIKNHWAEEDIIFVALKNLFSGIEKEIFSPDTSMTRGMFVTVLGRMYCY